MTFGRGQKFSCPRMENLYSINSLMFTPINCLQFVPLCSAQSRTKILKNIQLGHEPSCDRSTVTTEGVIKRGFDIRIAEITA
jgi:hypothetical protein